MSSSGVLEELSMDYKVAKCIYDATDVEIAIKEQHGSREVFFMGLDKTSKGVCDNFIKGTCLLGELCPLRHLTGEKNVVCKHWLRGLCKKGDQCEFLHEYDLSKMPECFFFVKYGVCGNKECPFLHVDPESKIKDCPWYDRGFCRHGPYCKLRHSRRVLCPNFLSGFCPDGKDCKFVHASFKIPVTEKKETRITCYNCHEIGHKAANCPCVSKTGIRRPNAQTNRSQNYTTVHDDLKRKALDEITCFRCGEIGHYANRCKEGPMAFLSDRPQNDTPKSDGQEQKALGEITCFKCGKIGHYANQCTKGSMAFLEDRPNFQL